MKVGVVMPQGWLGEYHGWEHDRAWERSLWVAREADRLGFDSVWVFDHFQTTPSPREELTFEAFSSLAAIAAVTSRAQIGPLVACAGYRNPALLAKMTGTIDVISGGRFVCGVGAGWKRDEYLAYGYGFPALGERMALLRDTLEILTGMLGENVSSASGRIASTEDAFNVPRGLQRPRVPIMVGGNGPNVTWRLAAKYADELNLDGPLPPKVREMLPVIRQRCEEIDRDPATLAVSVHAPWEPWERQRRGSERAGVLADYAELGITRVQAFLPFAVADDDALDAFAEDVRAAGLSLG